VTDFLDLRFWPAFNLADTFIVTGVTILLAALVAAERQPRLRRKPAVKRASA
jgi:lipoprotein signal peptidase